MVVHISINNLFVFICVMNSNDLRLTSNNNNNKVVGFQFWVLIWGH